MSKVYIHIYVRVNTRPDIEKHYSKIARMEEIRNARRETNRSLFNISCHNINMITSRYELDALPSAQRFATLTIRKTTLVNVFLGFVTQSLIDPMIAVIP